MRIGMLPENAIILFVHAYNLTKIQRITQLVYLIEIKIINLAETVTAELERINLFAKDRLTQIKGMVHVVVPRRITVGHYQFT